MKQKKETHAQSHCERSVVIARLSNRTDDAITTQTSFARNDKRRAFNLAEEGATHVGTCDNVRKSAFTLAEVLITLAIIGVVAAMTIPTLISSYQKQVTETRLKQTYAILQNTISLAVVDNGEVAGWGLSKYAVDYADEEGNPIEGVSRYDIIQEVFEQYFLPYMKKVKNAEFTSLENYGWKSYKLLSGERSLHPGLTGRYYIVQLMNGTTIMVAMNGSATTFSSIIFFVDINGTAGPNISGIDGFAFNLELKNGGFGAFADSYPSEEIKNAYCTNTLGLSMPSIGCASLIKRNGWKIPEDYPYSF
ncbi:type II secretion system protein [bacterium]|nr:type II secretion system protein [bacterium]